MAVQLLFTPSPLSCSPHVSRDATDILPGRYARMCFHRCMFSCTLFGRVQPVAGENMKQPPGTIRKRAALAYSGLAIGAYRVVIIQDGEFVRRPQFSATPRQRLAGKKCSGP
jgi:hypothetical protein